MKDKLTQRRRGAEDARCRRCLTTQKPRELIALRSLVKAVKLPRLNHDVITVGFKQKIMNRIRWQSLKKPDAYNKHLSASLRLCVSLSSY